MSDNKPWIEKRFDAYEVNLHCDTKAIINCSANQVIEIDKMYGPLAAFGVRICLEYTATSSDWVVYRERAVATDNKKSNTEWVEVTRWDCQLDWFKEQ